MHTDSIVSFAVQTAKNGQPDNIFLNTYQYVVQETTAPSPVTFSPADWAIVGAAFEDQIVDAQKVISSNQLVFGSVHMIEETNVTKPFGDWGLSGSQGGVAQGMLGDFDAYGFRMVRVTNVTRNGYKRLPGVPVGAFINGVLQSGFVAGVGAFETALEGTFGATLDSGDWTFAPRIVRYNNLGMPTAWQEFTIAAFYGLTTQNTRKR